MSTHLSSLELDEASAGLPLDAARSEHLSTCAECEQKLSSLRQANAALLASPRAQSTLRTLQPKPAPRRWVAMVVAGGLAAAAAAVFLVTPRTSIEDGRLKGAATVQLLDASGNPVSRAQPGDSVTLAVGGAGHTRVVVEAREAGQPWTPLWPSGGASGELQPGAQVRLSTFTVTPGSMELRATFSGGAPGTSTATWSLEVVK